MMWIILGIIVYLMIGRGFLVNFEYEYEEVTLRQVILVLLFWPVIPAYNMLVSMLLILDTLSGFYLVRALIRDLFFYEEEENEGANLQQ